MWTLMSAAMMLPSFAPAMRGAPLQLKRPWCAVASSTALYLLVWLAFGLVALYLRAASGSAGDAALILALALAAAWELTPHKRRSLLECRRSLARGVEVGGEACGAARLGARLGGSCLGSCWALMLVMTMAGSDQLLWAAGLTAVVSAEKLMRRPGPAIGCTVVVLAGLAVGFTLAATL